MQRLRARNVQALPQSYVCASCLTSRAPRGAPFRLSTSGLDRSLGPTKWRFFSNTTGLQNATKSPEATRLEPPRSKSGRRAGSKHESTASRSEPTVRGMATTAKGKGKGGGKSKDSKESLNVRVLKSRSLQLRPVVKQQPPVPRLSYRLDRVLFNQGVYNLQDPRSGVFNFDPSLAEIMPINEFDFDALKEYITSSKDDTLISIAAAHDKKYAGSTSSMTSMLAHFHYLLSAWRPLNLDTLSRGFHPESTQFTHINRAPAATFLHYKDGTYAIDADKEFDSANILSMLGKSMEKLLTLPKEEYRKYHTSTSSQIPQEQRDQPEAYHYTTMGDLMMRSQLDAFDPRLQGTGMFDLKTRAVVSIRMDSHNFKKGLGYEIRTRHGQWESYEREYFDMMRSAMLKYSLQVRMGRMDGIFVAFHNTRRIFGFQYISLDEMDNILHGSSAIGHDEFKLSLGLLNEILNEATSRFPKRSLRLHFETRPSNPPYMYVFAKPVTPEDIEEVQSLSKEAVARYERALRGLPDPSEAGKQDAKLDEAESEEPTHSEAVENEEVDSDEQPADGEMASSESGTSTTESAQAADELPDLALGHWEDLTDHVERLLEDEEQGVTMVREALEDAMEEAGLLLPSASDENRGYLDLLSEAVTGKPAASVGAASPAGSAPSTEGTTASPGHEKLDDQLVTETSAGNKPAEAVESNQTTSSETTGAAEGDSVMTTRSEEQAAFLKELILKLATSQDADTGLSASSDGSKIDSADQAQLRKFSQVLAELRAKSKQDKQAQGAPAEDAAPHSDEAAAPHVPELLGFVVTAKNKVNKSYVDRPDTTFKDKDTWQVEYSVQEMPSERAQRIYPMILARRKRVLGQEAAEKSRENWKHMFGGALGRYSAAGAAYRQSRNAAERKAGRIPVAWSDGGLRYTEFFGKRAAAEAVTKFRTFIPPSKKAASKTEKKLSSAEQSKRDRQAHQEEIAVRANLQQSEEAVAKNTEAQVETEAEAEGSDSVIEKPDVSNRDEGVPAVATEREETRS